MARKHTKENLTQRKLAGKLQDVRAIVKERAKEMKMTAYRLAKVSGVTEQTLRNFLNGTHEMRSDKLERVMMALELEIRPKRIGIRDTTKD